MTDGENGGRIWICSGVNKKYRARARYYGMKEYVLLGTWTRSKPKAMRDLVAAIISNRYKRGDVLMIADYYDPIVIVEMVVP